MRGMQLVSQRERLKINNSPSRHLQVGCKILRRNAKSDRNVTKYVSNKDNATLEEIVEAAELFKKQTVM
jgi:hypothetical protein